LNKEKRFFFEKKKQKTFGPCGLWRELGATLWRMADFYNIQQILLKLDESLALRLRGQENAWVC
jgi:hypothetical protein